MTIELDHTIYEITEAYPETLGVFVDAGFSRMADRALRERFGSSITVAGAAGFKGLDPEALLRRLRDAAASSAAAVAPASAAGSPAVADGATSRRGVEVTGLLPCPVRTPLLESFAEEAERFTETTGREVTYSLQAAYTGPEWMEDNIRPDSTIDDLPDVFVSAGYRLFFSHPVITGLRDSGAFADRRGFDRLNDFGETSGLRDPQGDYSIIGVVPAIMAANTEALAGRPVPRSWEELLEPRYADSVAMPVADFDLFDGLLLSTYLRFGESGLLALGRNLVSSMHPSQMVKGAANRGAGSRQGDGRPARPAVTVMPYFFSRTIRPEMPVEAIWPADGAISAPILLLTRRDRPEIQPIVDFFGGLEVAKILTHMGLFPATHPGVEDPIPRDWKIDWPGWEVMRRKDIGTLMDNCVRTFDAAREGVTA